MQQYVIATFADLADGGEHQFVMEWDAEQETYRPICGCKEYDKAWIICQALLASAGYGVKREPPPGLD